MKIKDFFPVTNVAHAQFLGTARNWNSPS